MLLNIVSNRQSKPQIPDLNLSEVLPLCGPVLHAGRSVAQADVYPLEWNGQPAILKTFHARPWLVRFMWSRRVAAREARMLMRLLNLRDVPQLLATAGPEAYIMTRLEARRLPRRKEPPPLFEFWARARELLDEMHARGIAHGDLRRKNLLMNEAATEPSLIDFATAVARPPQGAPRNLDNWIKAFLFDRCVKIDRITFARIKRAYKAPLTSEERAWLDSQPWYLKAGRFFKRRIYRLRKRAYWRNRLRRWRKDRDLKRGCISPRRRK